jgi:DNA invertase Pin-like site-specific DNA recombinase
MSQTIAYLRTSTDKQDLGNQKLEILEWARKKDLKIDEFVQITMSSRKTRKQRRIEEVLQMLADDYRNQNMSQKILTYLRSSL